MSPSTAIRIARMLSQCRKALVFEGEVRQTVAMSDPLTQSTGGIVVKERKSSVHFLWGFLTLTFAGVLVLGHRGAETSGGRLTIDILFGGLAALCLFAWIYMVKNPGRFEVTRDMIRLAHKGGKRTQDMPRVTGELYFHRTGAKYPQPTLRQNGTEEAFILGTYDTHELKRACESQGWRFVQ
jgi:hypothetical protein